MKKMFYLIKILYTVLKTKVPLFSLLYSKDNTMSYPLRCNGYYMWSVFTDPLRLVRKSKVKVKSL